MPESRHLNTEDERGVASRQRPVLIGVTGGIGSGKSTVIDLFVQRHGAARFSADEAVHALYATEEVRDAVTARWGDRVVASDGTIDRNAIAAIVFPDASERVWLEGLLHPLVAREWLRFVHEIGERGHEVDERGHEVGERAGDAGAADRGSNLIVAEVPLLFEADLDERYDKVVLVTAPVELRRERVGERATGGSHLEHRLAAQLTDEQKAARADYVIENTGDVETLATRVAAIVEAVSTPLPEQP